MLIAIGLDTDPTLSHFTRQASRMVERLDLINLRAAVGGEWCLPLNLDTPAWIAFGGRRIDLRPEHAVYCRLIDLSSVSGGSARRRRWRSLISGLAAWLEQTPGRVANRPGHSADNGSKPLHETWLRRNGFAVPESLTSSQRDRLTAFAEEGPCIAKSVAGVRADTRRVTGADFADFTPERGPVHLQRRIIGRDARLHVIGQTVHAELIESQAVDYRVAPARFRPFEPPADLAAQIVAATRQAGLVFAGWDFKLDDDGRFWCLEANPMPGYDSYDRRAQGAITRSLVEQLISRP
ncbi:ATP-grasp domain-containing protein [Caulobacter sp.]|uniref:ATP-grasp domain-containing protein n=1 Tax=Caulobacter sp. TaxID=78 RepID=UPI003BA979A5